MANVFVCGEFPGDAIAHLATAHDIVVDKRGLEHAPADAEAILTMVSNRVDESVLARLPKLKIVANVAVGVDNIDLAACKARGVIVTNTPDVLTEATADLAFGLLLAAARRVAASRAGPCRHRPAAPAPGARIRGRTPCPARCPGRCSR